MSQPINTIEKKLQFHCSTCQTTWQLLVLRTDNLTNDHTHCLNNCLQNWNSLLVEYCQEQIILDLTRQEQAKDRKKQALAEWLKRINQSNQPK